MFKAIAFIALLLLTTVDANAWDTGGTYAPRNYQTKPNVFGGQDIYQGYHQKYQTKPNVFGGQDIYQGYRLKYQTKPNVFGGQDIHGYGGDW